ANKIQDESKAEDLVVGSVVFPMVVQDGAEDSVNTDGKIKSKHHYRVDR
ncbi:MAG: hypothetical protein ACI9BF_000613, partial [Candidatus Paceibacteria bacterium]